MLTPPRSNHPSAGSATGLSLDRGGGQLLFNRHGLGGGGELAPPDQERSERGERKERNRHHQGSLHGVDVPAYEHIVGEDTELLLHGRWQACGQLGSVLSGPDLEAVVGDGAESLDELVS